MNEQNQNEPKCHEWTQWPRRLAEWNHSEGGAAYGSFKKQDIGTTFGKSWKYFYSFSSCFAALKKNQVTPLHS